MSVSHRHSLAMVLIACLILGLVSPPRASRAQAPVPAVPSPEATEIVGDVQKPIASAITLPSPPQIIVGSTFSTDRAKNGQLIGARLVLRAVSELESPGANLTVTVTLPEGLEFVDGSSKLALYNPSQRQLTWHAIRVMPETNFMDSYQLLVRAASTPINLAIHIAVNGGAVDCCAVMPANIMVRGDRRAPQSVNALLDGRVRMAERVSVDFAPAAFKSNLAIGVAEFAPLLVTGTLPGLFFPFELEPDTEPGEVFGAPVTLTVDLEGLVPIEAAQAGMRPVLLYFRPEVITRTVVIDGDANGGGTERVVTATIEGAQEIDSTYDVETKLLTAQLTHFSGYAISFSQPKPEPWKLNSDGGEVSLFRGAATYAYPIILPAALDSQTPDISLHYSSAAADSGSDGSLPGLGLSTGKGWDLSVPRITRVVQRRWQLAPWKTGDQWWNNWSKCSFNVQDYWAYCYPYLETRYANDFTLTLGGQNHNLVPKFDINAQAGGEYVTEDYQPLRILRCNARYPCAGNDVVPGVDNTTGESWQVWTPDGTRYVLGADTNSTNLVRAEALNANTDVACYNGAAVAHAAYAGTGGADNCAIPRIWFLKRVYAANRDSVASGRWSIEYSYAAGEDDIYGPGPQPCDACHAKDPWLRPASILYGPSLRSNGQAATKRYKVQFAYSWGPRLSSISTGVADANGNVTTWLRRYAIRVDQGWPGYPSASHVLYDIAEQTWNGSAWVTGLPLTSFTYTELPHNNGQKTLLKKVANGYGAEWEYAYAGDAGMSSYWVITATTRNGMGWESLHTYEYSPERCFSTDAYAGQCVNAAHVHWGQWPNTLIGFRQVTEKVRDASNATLSTAIHTYHYADLKLLGREHTTRVTGAAGKVLQATQTDYLVQNGPSYVPANSWFVAPSMVREYLAGDVGSSPYRRTDYAHNATFGNVTAIYEHGLYGIAGDERSTHRVYSPNTASWLVNKVTRENVYDTITEDTGGAALKTQSWLYYDGSSSNGTPPTKGLLTKIERGAGTQRVTQLASYDAAGHLSSVTDGRGVVTTGGYDADGWFLLWLRNAANHLTQYVRYGVNDGACSASGLSGLLGSVKCAIDPNGASTAYGYDAYGRLTSVVRPYDSASIPTLRYQYSDAGQTSIAPPLKIETLRREAVGCANCTHSAIEFIDGLGRPVQSRIESGSGSQQRVVNTTYDPLGLVQHSYEPVFESASTVFVRPAGWDGQPRSTTSYDALGRRAVISHTNGTATRMSYSAESTGLTTVVTDALGRRRERVADGREQLTAVRGFSGTGVYTTRYQYDVFGNLTRLIDAAGNQTTLTYDALGRKTALNDPDLGAWSYAYDGNSNLVSQTDARGQVLRFDYDALNRMTRKWLNSTNATLATYTYDTGVYAIGRRTSMANANDTTTWSYDARGRVITESRTIAGVGGPYSTSYAYDAADRVVKTRYPSGEFVTAAYDAGMQPLSLSGTSAYVTGATYTAQDQVSRIQLGNGLSARYVYWGIDYFGAPQYQNYGHLRRVCVLPQSSTVDCESDPTNSALRLNFGYNVDKVGNVTIIRDELNLQRQQFNYDPLNRLVAAVPNPLPGQPSLIPDYTETYALDAIGNLTYKSTVGNYAYGAYSPSGRYLPHAVSTAGGNTYAYDNNGNMVRRVEGGVVYSQTWDVENRLTYVSGSNGKWAQYAYDAGGVLVRRNTSGQTTAYIGPHYELANGAATSYYYLGEQRVAMRTSSAVYWLHSDLLGSASLATNSSGAAVANSQTRYKPFGQIRLGGSGLPTDRRFTGQRSDESAIGLYDYRARFYDPLLGRFISPDPLVPSAADPQMLNRFSYARNSPMRYTDSTGHWIESAFDIASIIYDVGEIAQNGLNWENGLSLAADIGGLILPGVTGGGLLVRGAAKVLSHAGDAVKAAAYVEDAARAAAGIKKVTKADIVADLASGTRQSKQIAKAIEGGDIKVHILAQKKFEILYKPINKYDEVTYVQAFARQSHIYLRKSSTDIFCDAVHEGTHALDYINKYVGPLHGLEIRAYRYAEQFQKFKRRSPFIHNGDTIEEHVRHYYPNVHVDWSR